MVESMRAYGYTVPTAIADLVDNSIAAGAATVWIESHWDGPDSWIAVTDDGRGMLGHELSQAMRLGSQNPMEPRTAQDLGRFGLGLKTASFSQCRRLTVFSKAKGAPIAVRRWDLDHLAHPDTDGWELLLEPHEDFHANVSRLAGLKSGTTIVWEVLDRIVQAADRSDDELRAHFFAQVDELEAQLGMVFHRYLATTRPAFRILLNDEPIPAWDPFAERHPATDRTPEEIIALPGHHESVSIRGFVLPHRDKLSEEDRARLAGPKGWNAQQGFYLYRNKRLIISGSWLGLGGSRPWTQEEHYKLARMQLDIPNSMDHLWQLDVKKSHASPPPQLRPRIRGLAKRVRDQAREVYRHRGKHRTATAGGTSPPERVWKRVMRRGQPAYQIDRKHTVVGSVLKELSDKHRSAMDLVLTIAEETVPVEQIWIDAAETPEGRGAPFHNTSPVALKVTLMAAYRLLTQGRSLTHEEAIRRLSSCEEFSGDEAVAILTSLREGGSE